MAPTRPRLAALVAVGLRAFAIAGDREVLGHELGLDRPLGECTGPVD